MLVSLTQRLTFVFFHCLVLLELLADRVMPVYTAKGEFDSIWWYKTPGHIKPDITFYLLLVFLTPVKCTHKINNCTNNILVQKHTSCFCQIKCTKTNNITMNKFSSKTLVSNSKRHQDSLDESKPTILRQRIQELIVEHIIVTKVTKWLKNQKKKKQWLYINVMKKSF